MQSKDCSVQQMQCNGHEHGTAFHSFNCGPYAKTQNVAPVMLSPARKTCTRVCHMADVRSTKYVRILPCLPSCPQSGDTLCTSHLTRYEPREKQQVPGDSWDLVLLFFEVRLFLLEMQKKVSLVEWTLWRRQKIPYDSI